MLRFPTSLPLTSGPPGHVSSFVTRPNTGGLKAGMPPFSSLRTRRHSFFSLLLLGLLSVTGCQVDRSHPGPPGTNMIPCVIDGQFQEWNQQPPASPMAAMTNGRTLWIQFQLATPPVSLQNLPEPWTLDIEYDDPSVADQRIIFSPAASGHGIGAVQIDQGGERPHSPYAIHFQFAPTIAASRFELALRMPRSTSGTVVLQPGRDTEPMVATFELPSGPAPGAAPGSWPADAAGDSLRIVSWNVLYGNLLHERERAGRILAALDPDVLLLQELEDQQDPGDVADMLNTFLGDEPLPWNVVASPTGSGLRSMAAARGGVHLPEAGTITRLDDPQRFLRAALLGVPTKKHGTLIVASVHLRCCGGPGDDADLQRMAEALTLGHAIDGIVNEMEARNRALHQSLGEPMPTGSGIGVAGMIIGGDLNLVGSGAPLTILSRDRAGFGDGSGPINLVVADPLHLDGSSNATWSDKEKSFTPGRLDYLLYSPSSLASTNAFILDTTRLAPGDLDQRSLSPEDSPTVSDHAPLVLDVVLRNR